MAIVINKLMEWIPVSGFRDQIVAELRKDCVTLADMGDHLWVVTMNHDGSRLSCYGLAVGSDGPSGHKCWYLKKIPEFAGPDVYDCPLEVLEAALSTNDAWREKVREWHNNQTG